MLPIFSQYGDFGFLVLSLVVSIIFGYHGWPKLTKPEGMAKAMGWPSIAVRILGAIEVFGGLALFFGLYTQISALLLSLVMISAIYTKITKWHIPFSTSTATGWEFDLALLAATLLLLTNSV